MITLSFGSSAQPKTSCYFHKKSIGLKSFVEALKCYIMDEESRSMLKELPELRVDLDHLPARGRYHRAVGDAAVVKKYEQGIYSLEMIFQILRTNKFNYCFDTHGTITMGLSRNSFRDLAHKHYSLADKQAFTSYCGEIIIDGTHSKIIINNNSGTYKPNGMFIDKVAKIFKVIFDRTSAVIVPQNVGPVSNPNQMRNDFEY